MTIAQVFWDGRLTPQRTVCVSQIHSLLVALHTKLMPHSTCTDDSFVLRLWTWDALQRRFGINIEWKRRKSCFDAVIGRMLGIGNREWEENFPAISVGMPCSMLMLIVLVRRVIRRLLGCNKNDCPRHYVYSSLFLSGVLCTLHGGGHTWKEKEVL